MVKDFTNFQMERIIKVNLKKGKSKDMVSLNKIMDRYMKEGGIKVNSKVKEFIHGKMGEFMMENLKILCLLGLAKYFGKMELINKEYGKMTKICIIKHLIVVI